MKIFRKLKVTFIFLLSCFILVLGYWLSGGEFERGEALGGIYFTVLIVSSSITMFFYLMDLDGVFNKYRDYEK